jgi:hypothetical protein
LARADLKPRTGYLRVRRIDHWVPGRSWKLTNALLNNINGEEDSAFTESEGEMVRRVCRGLGTKKNIIILNDEGQRK